ncbi:MAG: hypothetical protein ACRDGJ_09745 [Candidatus Limnocylindria bacterium]
MPFRELMSAHALREARREGISLDEIEESYVYPDFVRTSHHEIAREIRSLYVGDAAIEVVVDTIDGRVVTVWRKHLDP